MRVAYLGPAGTFSEDALRAAAGDAELEPLPAATIYDAIVAVGDGAADRALVPFENSIEGSVRATLDALAFDAPVGGDRRRARPADLQQPDRPRASSSSSEIEVVISHPQASAQCARFIRAELPRREVRAAPSTAEAVREVAESRRALGGARRAPRRRAIYGCVVLREGVEDEPDNVTRFVWLAPGGHRAGGRRAPGGRR